MDNESLVPVADLKDFSYNTFHQDDDSDIVIPDRIALPLVFSSHLLLVTSIVSIRYKDYGIFAVTLFLYFTSVFYWHKPRFSRKARILDYFAVFVAIAYGSYYASTLSSKYTIIWFCGLIFIGIIFVTNEVSTLGVNLNNR